MLTTLRNLQLDNIIRPLDYQFARFIYGMDNSPALALASAATSYELGKGNVCLELDKLASEALFDLDLESSNRLRNLADSEGHSWHELLMRASMVSDGGSSTPLVLENGRLYLYRYWQHESRVASYLRQKNDTPLQSQLAREILDRLFQRNYEWLYQTLDCELDDNRLRLALIKWLDIEIESDIPWPECLDRIRKASSPADLVILDELVPQKNCLNWQKVAAAVAARQPFSVISGGPGTGKTTTVTRLLAMLVELGLASGSVPDIKLVAPTGKASARLTESISDALPLLNCSEEVQKLIPTQAGTIHRLLGVIPNRPEFRHNAENKLHLDILVVDEASMIDLTLMRKLLEALPDHARVIMLGDREQLSSVDAGSVLGDICKAADGGYSSEQINDLEALTGFQLSNWTCDQPLPIKNRFCLLRKSYRFDANSGIGHLATAVNQGNKQRVNEVWNSHFEDIRLYSINDTDYQNLLNACVAGYRLYLKAISDGENEQSILKAFNAFRLLCALREGRYGVEGLNESIRQALAREHLIPSEGLWYVGRPVLITQNAHGLGLYNGDIGVTLPDQNGRLKVAFEMPDGSLKSLLPSRLPQHQTVFAMTVHKSQGSEFAHTIMVLPDKPNPVLTRELIYTGITRAKKRLDIYANNAILTSAIEKPTRRFSGLIDKLLVI